MVHTTSAASLSLLNPLLLCKLELIIQGNIPVENVRVQVLVMELCEDIIWIILFSTAVCPALVTKGQPG